MAINDYIGIPYLSRGRTIEGLDCWGLVILLAAEYFNSPMPSLNLEYADSGDSKAVAESVKATKKEFTKVYTPREKAIVLIRLAGIECHVGIMISPVHFIHSLQGHNSCRERIDSKLWEKRIEGYYTWN